MSLLYNFANCTQIAAMTTIVNWSKRSVGFLNVAFLFFFMMGFQIAEDYTYRSVWVFLTSGILHLTLFPFLIWQFFILDPLDAGIIINEAADIMNSQFSTVQWQGRRISSPV